MNRAHLVTLHAAVSALLALPPPMLRRDRALARAGQTQRP